MNAQLPTLDQSDSSWQLKLLPFMTRAIAVMGFLFFISSFVQFQLMYHELKVRPESARFVIPSTSSINGIQSAESLRWNGLLALEHETLVAREKTMNAVVLRQASLLHLGFLTGMVLCLVGAVFVLGRLQTPESSLSGQVHDLALALNTSSPGIVLAALGCALMCVTLFHQYQFNLPDKTVYVLPSQYAVSAPIEISHNAVETGAPKPALQPAPREP
jgi:hypothetical protein